MTPPPIYVDFNRREQLADGDYAILIAGADDPSQTPDLAQADRVEIFDEDIRCTGHARWSAWFESWSVVVEPGSVRPFDEPGNGSFADYWSRRWRPKAS